MQLTVRDVSRFLNVSERTIYRWINQGTIPAYRILDQYRFNRAELLEWATVRRIKVSQEIFNESEPCTVELPTFLECMETGGIYYNIKGTDIESALRNVVNLMHLAPNVDRALLLQILLAREVLASTGIGDGIAIPHVRNPIVMNIPYSMVTLCFLEKPVNFGALDGQPVHCLFTVVSQTVRVHLHLLSKLAFFLKDPAFKTVVLSHEPPEQIFREAKRLEHLE